MKVQVASLRQPTFYSELSGERFALQSIEQYAEQEIKRRLDLIYFNIQEAAANKPADTVLFFTLPEFFWNIKWGVLKSHTELHQFTDYMMTHLSDRLDGLMKSLPAEKTGKVVLLGGSLAVLVKKASSEYHEAINYALMTNNFKKTAEGDRFEMSMWPKRNTSHIDFGAKKEVYPEGYGFQLSDAVFVKVVKANETVAEHNTAGGFGAGMDNTLVEGCPFSINLCLDYGAVKFGERDNEAMEKKPKVDFLMACGMPTSPDHKYPASTQYAVRNDGMQRGETEFFAVSGGRISRVLKAATLNEQLTMVTLDIA
ncbi:hypothetical protein ACGTI2_09470 [Morganella morganii]|uniref:hypothetical protein n=1 Tax=Morganella morganii TaxID=582 RepID=UPI003864795A